MLETRHPEDSDQHGHVALDGLALKRTSDRPRRAIATRRLANGRSSLFPILSLFLERRSSRAFSGEAVSRQQVATLLEAARWAPSSFNEQPWRFVIAGRDSASWERFLSWLSDSNREWCERASALVLVAAKAGHSPRTPHDFDTGAAWGYLALQAVASGLIAHAVAGFDRDRAAEDLGIPFSFHPVCMVAIGVPGRVADLPERLQSREAASQRKALHEIAFDGTWDQPFSLKGASR